MRVAGGRANRQTDRANVEQRDESKLGQVH